MRKLITLSLLNFIGLSIFAQSEYNIVQKEMVIGKNHVTNNDIVAKELVFPEMIRHTYFDTTNHFVTVQLKEINEK